MTRAALRNTTIVAVLVSLGLVPGVLLAVREIVGPAEAVSVLTGSLLSTGFFVSTALATFWTWNKTDFRAPLMAAYLVKISALVVIAALVPKPDLDSGAFATGAAISAVSYLITQVIGLSQIGSIRTSDRV